MISRIPRAAEPLAGAATTNREWYRWFDQLQRHVDQTGAHVPLKGWILAFLTVAEQAAYFDATGLGNSGTPWSGWALCNGNNGTTDVIAAAAATFAGALPVMRVA